MAINFNRTCVYISIQYTNAYTNFRISMYACIKQFYHHYHASTSAILYVKPSDIESSKCMYSMMRN